MRILQAILMSILVLFSSGGAQMAYHICEEDGMHLIFDNCNESAAQELSKGINSDCCKSTQVEYAITENCKCDEPQEANLDDCCTEGYFFALSPYPSVFTKFTLANPLVQIIPSIESTLTNQILIESNNNCKIIHEKPPSRLSNLYLNDLKCVWLI